jgi:hypothetical protein
MAKKTRRKTDDEDLDAFIESLLTPADLEARKAPLHAVPGTRRADASIFANVTSKARQPGPYTGAVSVRHDNKVVKTLEGCEVTLGFDSEQALTRYIASEFPPELAAWRRIAQIARQAQHDTLIAKSSDALEFLRMVEALTNNTSHGLRPDEIMKPITEILRRRNAMEIRKKRTENGSALVKKKALELYRARKWASVAAAARGIFNEVQTYAKNLTSPQVLSEERFEKTLREWINQTKVQPATR